MNVTELARKLRINAVELLEVLPQYGFDVGKRAIKIDDKIALQIQKSWARIQKDIEYKKREEEKKQKALMKEARASEKKVITIPQFVTVRDFAQLIDVPVGEIIKELMKNGILATLNERVDFDTASIIAGEFGITLSTNTDSEGETKQEERLKEHFKDVDDQIKRPPVIVIMGHVDHGKTKLLDTIRSANVMGGEAGGITQHIGAYQIDYKGKKITFIDTPGHEAFTAMRSRGAKVADIAILVVAADDSIKPQTKEAIKIIKQSGVPMIVAINKIDKEGANVDKVYQDLAQENLTPEAWGGNVICQPISAKNNLNIDKLLDSILLIDEMEADKIKANPDKKAAGTIIEAHVDSGEGPVATVLVQSGTLKIGDHMMFNDAYFGKARALRDHYNLEVTQATPSTPVKILGLKYLPKVGDLLEVPEGEVSRSAKKVEYHDMQNSSALGVKKSTQDEDDDKKVETIKIIAKADTLGSLEVINESLEKLGTDKVKVKLLKKGLGNVTDSDVTLAFAEGAILVAFHVKPLASAQSQAQEKDVKIHQYTVIYKLIDDIREKMTAMIKPEIVRELKGTIQVLAIFKSEKNNMILGGKVLSGLVQQGLKADVVRAGTLYESGKIAGLQSGKQEVKEVAAGNECGFKYTGSNDVQIGDIIEVYLEKEVKGKL